MMSGGREINISGAIPETRMDGISPLDNEGSQPHSTFDKKLAHRFIAKIQLYCIITCVMVAQTKSTNRVPHFL